jgi:hypothetical protein
MDDLFSDFALSRNVRVKQMACLHLGEDRSNDVLYAVQQAEPQRDEE